ncbi:ABC transporter permease [Acetobacter malorum]|uniref:ABC transporter permease n=1 Tax=Acetobacter malorum TaxID=178901 RepID=UPI0039E8F3E1
MKSFLLIVRLAWRDLLAERVLALCLLIGLTATAAPLLVLAGLRTGLVEGLRSSLLENPHVREISSASNKEYQTEWLANLKELPTVSYLAPKTRTLAASVLLVPEGRPADGRHIELIPSSPGDPLLLPQSMPVSSHALILSSTTTTALHLKAGDKVEIHIPRLGGNSETTVLPLVISDIASPRTTLQDAGFVSLRLAQAVEIYRENPVSWQEAWLRGAALAPTYPGFRLYARHIEDVPALDKDLRSQGIEITSHAGDVVDLLALDNRLTLLFRLTALLGILGFFASLSAGLWSGVQRKRLTLATMQFLGVKRLMLLPVLQGQFLAITGILAAFLGAFAVAYIINITFSATLPGGRPLCILDGALCLEACIATSAGAFIVSLAAALRTARIEPWEGISTP